MDREALESKIPPGGSDGWFSCMIGRCGSENRFLCERYGLDSQIDVVVRCSMVQQDSDNSRIIVRARKREVEVLGKGRL